MTITHEKPKPNLATRWIPHLKPLHATLISGALIGLTACSSLQNGQGSKTPTMQGTGGAVATITDEATQAALRILNEGGNAIDAAVAGAAALGVTAPFSCGVGGGGFLVAYIKEDDKVYTIDHRETAPASVTNKWFIQDGKEMKWDTAMLSGRSVGVPGTVRGWEMALKQWGSMPLSQVLAPAIEIAENGFTINGNLNYQISENVEKFSQYTSSSALYLQDGGALPAGTHFKNPDLAKTYRLLSNKGSKVFYQGEIGKAIVKAVNRPDLTTQAKDYRVGKITLKDLASYKAVLREPVQTNYRGYTLYGMGLPSSGPIAVFEALNIMENFDTQKMSPAEVTQLYLEASKLAFADRNRYLADPDFVEAPVEGLLNQEYADEQAKRIQLSQSLTTPVTAGDPSTVLSKKNSAQLKTALDQSLASVNFALESDHTTHFTVADALGNVVSYTFTIEDWGGNGNVVPGYGFLLNNEMTDFDFDPKHPNAPKAGKRPRSSMAPIMAFKDGKPAFTMGSPGGSTIITTVLQTVVNHIDLNMSLANALAAPRQSQRNGATTTVEKGFIGTRLEKKLSDWGQKFKERPSGEIGAANALFFEHDGSITAISEPQRHGVGSAAVQQPK